jgi:hypothetical protein
MATRISMLLLLVLSQTRTRTQLRRRRQHRRSQFIKPLIAMRYLAWRNWH